MPYFSKVNPKYEFDQCRWVVSLINTGSMLSPFGHNLIVVEGIEINPPFFYKELFVGQYEVTDIVILTNDIFNKKGYISKIRSIEEDSYTYPGNYSKLSSKSYLTPAIKAKNMIQIIKEDVEKVKKSIELQCDYLEYQVVGEHHFLSDQGKGINCTQWCLEKLAMAEINIAGSSKPKLATGILNGNEQAAIQYMSEKCLIL